jgi:hypothetical protein
MTPHQAAIGTPRVIRKPRNSPMKLLPKTTYTVPAATDPFTCPVMLVGDQGKLA